MAFKSGLIVGFAAGYVLGAKAGRQRYEQISAWWNRFSGNPRVQQFTERGKVAVGQAGRKGLVAVQQGVSKVGSSVKGRLGNGDDSFATGEAGL